MLFPRKVNGKYLLMSRPSDTGHTAFVGYYYNENGIPLDFGSGTTTLIGQYFDAFFVRLGP